MAKFLLELLRARIPQLPRRIWRRRVLLSVSFPRPDCFYRCFHNVSFVIDTYRTSCTIRSHFERKTAPLKYITFPCPVVGGGCSISDLLDCCQWRWWAARGTSSTNPRSMEFE